MTAVTCLTAAATTIALNANARRGATAVARAANERAGQQYQAEEQIGQYTKHAGMIRISARGEQRESADCGFCAISRQPNCRSTIVRPAMRTLSAVPQANLCRRC